MTREQFWQIIEATTAPTQEEQLEMCKRELQQLSLQELTGFRRQFMEFHFAAYHWDLWLVVWLWDGGMCSDDGFADFRSWLISRGRATYEAALRDPDALIEELSQTAHPYFAPFASVAGECYRDRTKEDPPDLGLRPPTDPAGGAWLRPQLKDRSGSQQLNRCVVFREMSFAEFAAIEREFPRLWHFCLQKGIIEVGAPDESTPEPAQPIPTPEEVAKAQVDPRLAHTNYPAYLTALAEAARKEYGRRNAAP